jgi:hypothetical protein
MNEISDDEKRILCEACGSKYDEPADAMTTAAFPEGYCPWSNNGDAIAALSHFSAIHSSLFATPAFAGFAIFMPSTKTKRFGASMREMEPRTGVQYAIDWEFGRAYPTEFAENLPTAACRAIIAAYTKLKESK